MYIDRRIVHIVLREQAKTVKSQLDMIESWDKRPKSDFTEDQLLALGNLCTDYQTLLDRYNTAVEAFK